MPVPGIQNSAGLQLQTSSPGVTQSGNFHIGGIGIAEQWLSSRGVIPGKTAATSQFFGDSNTVNGTGLSSVVAVGSGMTLGFAGYADLTRQSVVIGAGAFVNGDIGNIAIGQAANAGASAGIQGADGGEIAIGYSSQASHAAASNRTGAIAIGYQARMATVTTTFGGIAIGFQVQATNRDSVTAIGSRLTINAGNIVIVDSDAGAVQTLSTPNSLILGNSSHSNVLIAGVPLGGFKRRAVADVNSTITTTDNLVGYTSLTAARTVTLPAASSVPAGKSFAVADESGNCSGVNTITITPNGGDTFNGAAAAMSTAFAYREFYSDGVSKWIVTGTK